MTVQMTFGIATADPAALTYSQRRAADSQRRSSLRRRRRRRDPRTPHERWWDNLTLAQRQIWRQGVWTPVPDPPDQTVDGADDLRLQVQSAFRADPTILAQMEEQYFG